MSVCSTVLVIAAHPDDEVLGCGGSMAELVDGGARVVVAIMATGLAARGAGADDGIEALRQAGRRANAVLGVTEVYFLDFPDNRMDGVDRLDVVRAVEALIDQVRPDTLFTHHPGDLNIDHQVVANAVMTACRPQPGYPVRTILFFEVPSATEWQVASAATAFLPTHFRGIPAGLGRKLAALREYAGEMRAFPHARSLAAVEHLARWRGASCGMDSAEAFVVARWLL